MTETLFIPSPLPEPETVGGRMVLPADDVAEKQIISMLENATPTEFENGLNWYSAAHQRCITLLGRYAGVKSVEHAAGMVAALSPMQSWKNNVVLAERLMETGHVRGLRWVVEDAMDIFNGAHPDKVLYNPARNNQKVRSFYQNIARPLNPYHVTVDRHVIAMLVDDPGIMNRQNWIRPKAYQWAGDRVRNVAEQVGQVPNQTQAIAWVVWRRMQGMPSAPIEHTVQLRLSI